MALFTMCNIILYWENNPLPPSLYVLFCAVCVCVCVRVDDEGGGRDNQGPDCGGVPDQLRL